MNVTVENLAPCKKLVRVEIEAPKVNQAFEEITKDFQRQAVFAGFRPGKAPTHLVVKKYGKDIQEEVRRKLISDSYRQAIEEQKLDVLGQPDIEEIQFNQGQPLQFAATIETAPEFELPNYKGLVVPLEVRSVTDADVEQALEALREPRAGFKTVDRPVQTGDVVVVNYRGTTEGKPLTEIAPTAAGLTEKKNFWVNVPSTSFIPGFGEQLVGAKAGEQRSVPVDFPADFVTPQLAGKKGLYEVEVVEVKEKEFPPLDDAFAKSYGAESLEKLQEGVRRDLGNELKYKQERTVRNLIVRQLLDGVNFDLPESAVAQETRNVVYNIVQENAKRGVKREVIEQQKDQIASAASQGARERVKAAFLLQRIAEKEDIKVAEAEIAERINQLANLHQIPADKLLKDLKQRNGLIEIYDQVMNEKVLDFLRHSATIADFTPTAPPGVPSPS